MPDSSTLRRRDNPRRRIPVPRAGALIALAGCALLTGPRLPAQQEAPQGEVPDPELRLVRTLFLSGGDSHVLRCSPDGRLLASGGDRGDVVLTDAATGEVRTTLEASDHWVGGLRFSPDGRRLAAVGRDLTLWDVATGELLARSPAGSAKALDWSRDGSVLACVLDNNRAAVLDPRDLSVRRTFALEDRTAADAVALTRDGARLAVGKRSGTTQVFDVATGDRLRTLQQEDWVHDLAYLDDGRLLRIGWRGMHWLYGDEPLSLGKFGYSLAAQADGSRCAVRTDAAIHFVYPDGRTVEIAGSGPVALHPDGVQWARATAGAIEIRRGEKVVRRFGTGHRQNPQDAVLTGDGRFVVVVGSDLQVFDAENGQRLEVADLPEASTLVPYSEGTELVLWRAKRDDVPRIEFWSIGGPDKPRAVLVREVAFPDAEMRLLPQQAGPRLSRSARYLGFADHILDLLQPERSVFLDKILMTAMLPSPDGRHAVGMIALHDSFGGGKGSLQLFSTEGNALAKVAHDTAPLDMDFAPGGSRLAVATRDALLIYTGEKLELVRSLPLPWRQVRWIDGDWLIGSTSDGRLQVHHRDGEEVVSSLEMGSWSSSLSFDRERTRVLACTQDRVLLVELRR